MGLIWRRSTAGEGLGDAVFLERIGGYIEDSFTIPANADYGGNLAIDVESAKEELLRLQDQPWGSRRSDWPVCLSISLEEVSGESFDEHMADEGTITHDRELDESIQGH